jgi:hypothetical protein
MNIVAGCGLMFSSFACSGQAFTEDDSGPTGGDGGISAGGSASSGTGGSGGTGATGGGAGTGASGGAAGASGSGGATGDSGPNVCGFDESDVQCVGTETKFPEFETACTTTGDCALVSRAADCCGNAMYVGINRGDATCFEQAAVLCSSQFPGCGCPSFGASAEDGTFVPWSEIAGIIVECISGQCKSRWGGSVLECGDKRCIDGQRCDVFVGGPEGSLPSYSCGSLPPGCADCSCVEGVGLGCDCVASGGRVTVTCYAP